MKSVATVSKVQGGGVFKLHQRRVLIKDFAVPPPTLCQSLDPQGVPSITDIPSCPLIVVEMTLEHL